MPGRLEPQRNESFLHRMELEGSERSTEEEEEADSNPLKYLGYAGVTFHPIINKEIGRVVSLTIF